jgi:hypothetical protein
VTLTLVVMTLTRLVIGYAFLTANAFFYCNSKGFFICLYLPLSLGTQKFLFPLLFNLMSVAIHQ